MINHDHDGFVFRFLVRNTRMYECYQYIYSLAFCGVHFLNSIVVFGLFSIKFVNSVFNSLAINNFLLLAF